jgi:hypothetical protein
MGAIWKFKNSVEETMPTLKAIPPGVWSTLGIVEILCALALVLPALHKPWGFLVPIAALAIAAEMLLFTGLHFASGSREVGPAIYWLLVAALCGFTAYARLKL